MHSSGSNVAFRPVAQARANMASNPVRDNEAGSSGDWDIVNLVRVLGHRAPWIRRPAVEALLNADFEEFERPPRLDVLLGAMNAPELRDRARDSITRVLRGMAHGDPAYIGSEERRALRSAINLSRPQTHADFLVEASNTLLRIRDTEAIPVLEKLVERTTIRQYVAEEYRPRQGTTRRLARSFEGTPAEEHDVRRVRSAAHVACERLKLIAEKGATFADLLHPAMAPEEDALLRPAGCHESDPDHLLRPSTDEDAR